MGPKITKFTKGRVLLLGGRRYDFEHAEAWPGDPATGFPAHLRIVHKDGALTMLFWPAIAEIVEDRGAA